MNNELGWLTGKTVVITGGGRGIGGQIAEAVLGAGGFVVNISRSTPDPNRFSEMRRFTHLSGDISNPRQVEKLCDVLASKQISVDFYVHAAAIRLHGLIQETSMSDWEKIFQGNLFAPIRLWQTIVSKFSPSGGAALFFSSGAPRQLYPGNALYAASRSALETAVKIFALESATRNIRVNIIVPGPTDSPGFREAELAGKSLPEETLAQRIPLGRIARPEEVAKVALFLLSPDASFITGEVIKVNGGLNV